MTTPRRRAPTRASKQPADTQAPTPVAEPPVRERSEAKIVEILARYEALDRALVSRGFPATSPWWKEQVRRYFRIGRRRQVVLRVGRRGGKSSTLCRLGVVEALYGGHEIPPGDLGVVAIISHSRDEASQRLRTIKTILDALGVKYRPIDGGIEIEGRPIGFKVYTASIAGVSGFTAICVICDEVAKWRDADTGANPATEVLASVRPTMATQPLARTIVSSSPLGRLDAHAKAFDAGDDDFQIVAFAPTWMANPTITEADTRALERDEAKRLREYGAIPMEGDEESLLSAAALDRATRPRAGTPGRERGVYYVAAMDPGFTRNAWTFAIAALRWVDGRVRRSIVLAREWRGTPDAPLQSRWVLTQIAHTCRSYGIEAVYSDQYERFGLHAVAQEPEIDLAVVVPTWNATERMAAYESLERWAADEDLDIPADAQLRADLLGIRRKLTPNGFVIRLLETPDGRHCDYAPSVVLALAHATAPPESEAPAAPGSAEAFKAEARRLEQAVDDAMESEERVEREERAMWNFRLG